MIKENEDLINVNETKMFEYQELRTKYDILENKYNLLKQNNNNETSNCIDISEFS